MDADSSKDQPPVRRRQRTHSRAAIATGYLLVALALTAALQNRRIPDPLVYRLDEVIGADAPAEPAGTRIYFLFQAHDCRDQLHAITLLNDLHRLPEFQVAGFVVGAKAAEEVEGLVREAGIAFPLFPLREKQIHRSIRDLGYRHTPLIILSDDQRRVRGVLSGIDVRENSLDSFVLHFLEDTGDEE
jgi:hypothetical protein